MQRCVCAAAQLDEGLQQRLHVLAEQRFLHGPYLPLFFWFAGFFGKILRGILREDKKRESLGKKIP
jgi:hypothetical protein